MHRFICSRPYTECNETLDLRANGKLLRLRLRRLSATGFEGIVNACLQLSQLVRVDIHLREVPRPLSVYARVTDKDGYVYSFEVLSWDEQQRELMEMFRELVGNQKAPGGSRSPSSPSPGSTRAEAAG